MKYDELIKAIRTELSEAALADKEKEYVRAKACLLHIELLLEKALPPRYDRRDPGDLTRSKAIVAAFRKGQT